MDRVTVYAGQIPLETDHLKQSQNTMVGLAKLAAGVLGTSTLVSGFTCTPTGPASLNVIVTAGEIYQLENLEQSTWSSLSTETHTILKQGIVLDPTTFGITPPGTVGFSQAFLIEAQYSDTDSGSTVLPYFNAGNPALPFSGPGNAGTSQNTVRKGVAALQVKAGIAAATGTQITPSPDAGWTGIYVVTVANGAATITSGNISVYSGAPFLATNGYLPQIPTGVQNGTWTYADDTGTTNNLVVTLSPPPAAYTKGMRFSCKLGHDITGATVCNVNGLGNKAVVNTDGSALTSGSFNAGMMMDLEYDGTNLQALGGGAGAAIWSSGGGFNDVSSFTASYASQSIPNAVHTAVNFTSSSLGTSGDVSLASGACKVNKAGRYLVIVSGSLQTTSTNPTGMACASLFKNGSLFQTGMGIQSNGASSFQNMVAGAGFMLDLALNDLLLTDAYQVSGGALALQIGNTMTITRIH